MMLPKLEKEGLAWGEAHQTGVYTVNRRTIPAEGTTVYTPQLHTGTPWWNIQGSGDYQNVIYSLFLQFSFLI